jgi:hypothetical protein
MLLGLATATVVLVSTTRVFKLMTLCLIFLLAGLSFLTRYDSALFFLPVLTYVSLNAQSRWHVLIATAVGALLPIVWLTISITYYGDLLPTSFYIKTPGYGLRLVWQNARYIIMYLFFAGIIPVLILLVILARRNGGMRQLVGDDFRSSWWLYLALSCQLLYGLTMATHHMMFGFRFFVPYLPAAVMMVIGLLRRGIDTDTINHRSRRTATAVVVFLTYLFLTQGFQFFYVHNHSVNGQKLIGEFRNIGVRDYVGFIQTLQLIAIDIENHWTLKQGDRDRPPRVHTYAEGMMPYSFKNSYIYGRLVSYRHGFGSGPHTHQKILKLSADYVNIVAPRHGPVEAQLLDRADNYILVSSHETFYGGSMQSLLVYYNPNPAEHVLGPRIDDHIGSSL